MPPETKQIISRLEEMTCENCIYSINEPLQQRYWCRNDHNGYGPETPADDFCSKGKWLTGRHYTSDLESELNLEDYDDTYYCIVRAQMFPDAVSIADEYHIRQQVIAALKTIEFRLGEGDMHVQDVLDGIKSKLNLLWG